MHVLWIAFKNYYLRDEEQPIIYHRNKAKGCELLSKIIIFVTRNNFPICEYSEKEVVNCFQKLLSSWRGTTIDGGKYTLTVLWIAFKNYYLRDEEQHFGQISDEIICCELLSKIIIFVTRNNIWRKRESSEMVVNCFQKLLSSWRGTTMKSLNFTTHVLWIAFKNYYLRDEEQHFPLFETRFRSCELLSKIIIFVTRNNNGNIYHIDEIVVNCFQKLLSSWRGTTWLNGKQRAWMLWIAFKNYYLRDEEQRVFAWCTN